MNISENVFIADGAKIIGDVTINEDASVWFNAVIRGDEHPITIGKRSNIQDNAVVHVGAGYSCHIGDDVSIGHGAIVHGCEIGDGTLIGMGATILNGAKIGKYCIVGANALITEGKVIPDYSVVMGVPGKIVRQMTEADIEGRHKNVEVYVKAAKEYLGGKYRE
ncbi:MAG: gamma carbonic anhydrase family protein [Lachnospiraceae bacterium]|jgi:carbonic anhydrase/acetyltransferase-like protein (isoleucine patch superfamily)|nr:gamma carbonic anhydrase family protein [Lachnospiraceae bacterium]